jgi:hypothetical protein
MSFDEPDDLEEERVWVRSVAGEDAGKLWFWTDILREVDDERARKDGLEVGSGM